MKTKTQVAIALSGGVDSSVAAYVLQQAGYDVVGLTLWLHEQNGSSSTLTCGSEGYLDKAKQSALDLGIPHHIIDGRTSFVDHVLFPSFTEYDHGRTPNPCVLCNRYLKFGLLWQEAQKLGAQKMATGHYVKKHRDDSSQFYRGRDRHKDQSYFLFALDKAVRAATLFPLGDFLKNDVRQKAQTLGLAARNHTESQDICFSDGVVCFAEALRQRFLAPRKCGSLIDVHGQVLGQHDGIHQFTIGQRRGLGLSSSERLFVEAIDATTGNVFVSHEAARLYSRELFAQNLVWHSTHQPQLLSLCCQAQVRYRHAPMNAQVDILEDDHCRVRFDEPVRAITPGQAVVFYDGDLLLGGATIASS